MTAMRPPLPVDDPFPADDPAPWLSALADGQAWAVPQALRHWRDDDQARRTWHAYQLIGDVMRSDELAQPAAHDRALLDRVRQRLAEEPVLLAPLPATPPGPATTMAAGRGPRGAGTSRWLMPAGLAASLVLGTAWVLTSHGDPAAVVAGRDQARAEGTAPAPVTVAAAAAQRPAAAFGGDSLIRDPRLEEFLRVHQSTRGGVAGLGSGGGLRRVDAWVVSPAVPGPAAR